MPWNFLSRGTLLTRVLNPGDLVLEQKTDACVLWIAGPYGQVTINVRGKSHSLSHIETYPHAVMLDIAGDVAAEWNAIRVETLDHTRYRLVREIETDVL